MQIYAFCNLHDISWGNRPATTLGVEAVTANKRKQDELMVEYQVYRSNFIYLWIVANILYAVVSTLISHQRDPKIMNAGFTVIDALALFIAFLVIFKVICAAIYVIKWKVRVCRSRDYRRLGELEDEDDVRTVTDDIREAELMYQDFESKMSEISFEELHEEEKVGSLFSAEKTGHDLKEML